MSLEKCRFGQNSSPNITKSCRVGMQTIFWRSDIKNLSELHNKWFLKIVDSKTHTYNILLKWIFISNNSSSFSPKKNYQVGRLEPCKPDPNSTPTALHISIMKVVVPSKKCCPNSSLLIIIPSISLKLKTYFPQTQWLKLDIN